MILQPSTNSIVNYTSNLQQVLFKALRYGDKDTSLILSIHLRHPHMHIGQGHALLKSDLYYVFLKGGNCYRNPFLLLMAEILHQLRLVAYPIIHRVSYIPGGARFQPSTVWLSVMWWDKNKYKMITKHKSVFLSGWQHMSTKKLQKKITLSPNHTLPFEKTPK